MIAAVLLGREGSIGFPGKNVHPILGRPLAAYPMLAAQNAKEVDQVYLSTDSSRLKDLAREHRVKIIDRPAELASTRALAEDAYIHAYEHIRNVHEEELELLVLLFCNAPTVLSSTIDEGIERLREDPSLDSAVTVSCYNMWSPIRARRVDAKTGLLQPFAPLEAYGDLNIFNCDRDSQGDVLFADMGVSIVRPRCLADIESGALPQRWMGQTILPLRQEGGCDVDYEWQMPMVEHWLQSRGFDESRTPYDRAEQVTKTV